MSLREVVFGGTSDPNSIVVKRNGELMDFSTVTKMVCEFVGSSVVVDTNEQEGAGLIDWSAGSGVIDFKFNGLTIEPRMYSAILRVYDPLHLDGQTLAHPDGTQLKFKFVS